MPITNFFKPGTGFTGSVMNRSRKIIGVPWFTLETYGACRFQMADKDILPLDFLEWQDSADERIAEIEEAGQSAFKVRIDPARFPIWCRERGLAPDARARQRYANFYAFRVAIA
jgi:hypothetical protein